MSETTWIVAVNLALLALLLVPLGGVLTAVARQVLQRRPSPPRAVWTDVPGIGRMLVLVKEPRT